VLGEEGGGWTVGGGPPSLSPSPPAIHPCDTFDNYDSIVATNYDEGRNRQFGMMDEASMQTSNMGSASVVVVAPPGGGAGGVDRNNGLLGRMMMTMAMTNADNDIEFKRIRRIVFPK